MTHKQLEARIIYWKRKLGLHDWEFDISIDSDPGGRGDAEALVQCHEHYESAMITYRDTFPEWPRSKFDRVTVHELLHIKMRDLDVSQASCYDYLAPGVASMLKDQFEHEEEGHIEWLARLITELDAS